MFLTVSRRLLSFLLALFLWAAPVHAQQQPIEKIERGVSGDKEPAEKSDPVPAPQYALAGIATILLLVIICKPSRKGYRD
ncbi:MAG: hypothetical protein ACJ8FY_20050 [Gemmataceae bacterium]